MAELVLPLPRQGESFLDARGEDRTMRVSLHPERDLVVFSVWSGPACRASFQLPLDEAMRLSAVLSCDPSDSPDMQDKPDDDQGGAGRADD
jgi:hypothetical protein